MRPRTESAAEAAGVEHVDPEDPGRTNGTTVTPIASGSQPKSAVAASSVACPRRPAPSEPPQANGHGGNGAHETVGLIDRLMSPDGWRDLLRHDSIFWRRAIEAGVVHGPDAFVRYSPPLFGLAFALALPTHRRSVLENLRRVLPGRGKVEEYADVARVFATFASCLTESFVAGSDRGDRLHGIVVNDHHYVQAAEMGRGVIAATAHTGGWQAAGALLQSLHDPNVLVVMQRERDEKAQALHDGARARGGIQVAHIGQDPLDALPLLSHLRRRGVVAMQIDRLPRGMRGRRVELFGQHRLVPEGPLMLAAVSGAPIVPVFTRRLGYMTYEVFLAPAITLPRKPTPAELDEAAQRAITAMALYVRANPTQWFHFDVAPHDEAAVDTGQGSSPSRGDVGPEGSPSERDVGVQRSSQTRSAAAASKFQAKPAAAASSSPTKSAAAASSSPTKSAAAASSFPTKPATSKAQTKSAPAASTSGRDDVAKKSNGAAEVPDEVRSRGFESTARRG